MKPVTKAITVIFYTSVTTYTIVMMQSDWLRYSLSIFVNRYRVAASNTTRLGFSQKNNAYSSFFEIILNK